MSQDTLSLWIQRIIRRMIERCENTSVLFAAGAEGDVTALRRVLPKAEFALLRDDEGEVPAGFDQVLSTEELSPQSGFGVVYMGEALFALPEEEARQTYDQLLAAAEFVVLRASKETSLSHEHVMLRFKELCIFYDDEGAGTYAGANPDRHDAKEAIEANRPRYAVYGIYRNEEKFIERFLNSVKDADEIVMCDTGTTDKTNEIIEGFMQRNPEVNLRPYAISVSPWRFDDALNAALALVGGDMDVCIKVDADEMLMEGWRSVLDAHWDIRYTRYYHKFQTDWGNGSISRHNHDRPHVRRGYIWRLPVHEIIEYSGTERICWINDFWIYHAPDTKKSRGSYRALIEISAKERPDVWKTWGFLAGEYMAVGRFEDALAAIDKAMALSTSDKGHLNKFKFFIYRAQGKTDLALLHIDSAIAMMPGRREPYVEKARYLSSLGRHSEAYLTLRQAARQTNEITDYHHNAGCWGEHFTALMEQMKEAAQKEEMQ